MEPELKKRIIHFLTSIGIAPSHKGYAYLVYIIGLSYENYDMYAKIKDLFEQTGTYFGVTPRAVRDNIQTILTAYRNQPENCKIFKRITGYPTPELITLKEFILVIAEFLNHHS